VRDGAAATLATDPLGAQGPTALAVRRHELRREFCKVGVGERRLGRAPKDLREGGIDFLGRVEG
jgi:hypothetical protein